MNARKLVVSQTQIPQSIRNSLLYAVMEPPNSAPPFTPKPPSILATGLLKSYFERGLIREARTLFDEVPERDVVAWTTMISGYTSCNLHGRAWVVFCGMMRCTDVRPNEFTLSSTLKACKGMSSSSRGALVHGLVVKQGMSASLYVSNALLDVYATCCVNMDEASAVFHEIRGKNDVCWTTLIAGYTHRGDGYMGLNVFRRMLLVCILMFSGKRPVLYKMVSLSNKASFMVCFWMDRKRANRAHLAFQLQLELVPRSIHVHMGSNFMLQLSSMDWNLVYP